MHSNFRGNKGNILGHRVQLSFQEERSRVYIVREPAALNLLREMAGAKGWEMRVFERPAEIEAPSDIVRDFQTQLNRHKPSSY